MSRLIWAFTFLTRLPLPNVELKSVQERSQAAALFPLVGLVLGGVLAGVTWLAVRVFPPVTVSVLTLAAWVLLTGGLHLDGLMDTADGLLSGKADRESILRIMKDSRLGSMGAITLFLVLFLKAGFITALLPGRFLIPALVLAPVLGRWAMVLAMVFYPYARVEGGMGQVFAERTGSRELVIALATTGVAAWLVLGWTGLLVSGGASLVGGLGAVLVARRLGGLTGDVYGAINEIVEVATLFFLALLSALS